jgi:hypothetical protein
MSEVISDAGRCRSPGARPAGTAGGPCLVGFRLPADRTGATNSMQPLGSGVCTVICVRWSVAHHVEDSDLDGCGCVAPSCRAPAEPGCRLGHASHIPLRPSWCQLLSSKGRPAGAGRYSSIVSASADAGRQPQRQQQPAQQQPQTMLVPQPRWLCKARWCMHIHRACLLRQGSDSVGTLSVPGKQ